MGAGIQVGHSQRQWAPFGELAWHRMKALPEIRGWLGEDLPGHSQPRHAMNPTSVTHPMSLCHRGWARSSLEILAPGEQLAPPRPATLSPHVYPVNLLVRTATALAWQTWAGRRIPLLGESGESRGGLAGGGPGD
jgi:hypothetical protein